MEPDAERWLLQLTVRIAQALLGRLESGRKVYSIFGEGVNPLMRKMREALTMVGLPRDVLLKHGNKRIIYGVPLANTFRAASCRIRP